MILTKLFRRSARRPVMVWGAGVVLMTAFALVDRAVATDCDSSIALQVLGSGGPMLNKQRASAGYLLWVDGNARILLDAGGGTYSRFGFSGAKIEDLRLIALSHLHVDHATDLAAYIRGGYFSDRTSELPIAGPSAQKPFPGTEEFLQRLFGKEHGAYSYLSGTLDGTAGQFKTPAREVSVTSVTVQTVLDEPGLRVVALPVLHGPVPALAYRIEADNRVIVYAGDQNGDRPEFVKFAEGADLLIMPLAITETATGPVLKLHTKPSEVARIASESNAERILLSHIMPGVEHGLEEALSQVSSAYTGPVNVAEDMLCVELGD